MTGRPATFLREFPILRGTKTGGSPLSSLLRALTLFLLAIPALFAHPGHGLQTDMDGNFFFTDIARQTIWRADASGHLTALATGIWSHQLWRGPDGALYFTDEEQVAGEPGYSLHRLDMDGVHDTLIAPVGRHAVPSDIFTLNTAGDLFIAGNQALFRGTPLLPLTPLALTRDDRPFRSEGVRSLLATFDGRLVVVDRDRLLAVSADGAVTLLGDGLLRDNPSNIPIPDAPNPESINRLFGACADAAGGFYVAYFGNRQVLRVGPDGTIAALYTAEAPWSPVGVAMAGPDLIIKEHGFVAERGWIGPRLQRLAADGVVRTIVAVDR